MLVVVAVVVVAVVVVVLRVRRIGVGMMGIHVQSVCANLTRGGVMVRCVVGRSSPLDIVRPWVKRILVVVVV